MAARRERPPRLSLPRPLTGAVGPFLNLSHPSSHPLSLLIEFEIDFMPRGQMGARVVWIVFTFCENAHFTLLELDLTPTWPKLWSCHRAHPSDRESNSCNLVLISNTSHHLVLTLRSSQSRLFPLRDAACFDSSEAAAGTCSPLENMFSQKALLTQVIQSIQCRVGPTCYSRQLPNMNWKYGYMHGLRLRWIRNFLRWDSE